MESASRVSTASSTPAALGKISAFVSFCTVPLLGQKEENTKSLIFGITVSQIRIKLDVHKIDTKILKYFFFNFKV